MINSVDILSAEGLGICREAPLERGEGHEIVCPLVDLLFGNINIDIAVCDGFDIVGKLVGILEAASLHQRLHKALVMEVAEVFAEEQAAAQTVVEVLVMAQRIAQTVRNGGAGVHESKTLCQRRKAHIVVVLLGQRVDALTQVILKLRKKTECHVCKTLVQEVCVNMNGSLKTVGKSVHNAGVEKYLGCGLDIARIDEGHGGEHPHIHCFLGVDVVAGQNCAAGDLGACAAGGGECDIRHFKRRFFVVLGLSRSEEYLDRVNAGVLDKHTESLRRVKCRAAAAPTTAGSGSDVMGFAILTRADTHTKLRIDQLSFFSASFLDPEYISHSPEWLLDAGALDALAHGIEGVLNTRANDLSRLWNNYGFRLFKSFKDDLLNRCLTSEDYSNMLLAASVQGVGNMQCCTTIPHGLGYSLTHFKDVSHGFANMLVMAEFLRTINDAAAVTDVLHQCGFCNIDDFDGYMQQILRRNVAFTVTDEELHAWAKECASLKPRLEAHIQPISEDEIYRILRTSLKEYTV